MAARFVGRGDLAPLLQIERKTVRGGLVQTRQRALGHHHEARARGRTPALLRRGKQHIDAGCLHVDPDAARGDAVEHHQRADLMRGRGQGGDVVIGQDDPGGGLHMRGEDDVGLLFADPGGDLLDRRRGEGRLCAVAGCPGLHHGDLAAEAAGLEDLAPAEGEPAVAHHQRLGAASELAGDSLHAVGTAAWHDRHPVGPIDLAQPCRDVAHHLLEGPRHVVERAIRKDHREFVETAGVHILAQRHGHTPLLLRKGLARCAAIGKTSDGRGTQSRHRAEPARAQSGPGRRSSVSTTLASTRPTPGRVMIRRRSTRSKSGMSRATTRRR